MERHVENDTLLGDFTVKLVQRLLGFFHDENMNFQKLSENLYNNFTIKSQ